jgi:hypothetical protein
MLDEQQPPARLENPPYFSQRRDRVCDRAQRPRHHDRIEGRISEGELLSRGS